MTLGDRRKNCSLKNATESRSRCVDNFGESKLTWGQFKKKNIKGEEILFIYLKKMYLVAYLMMTLPSLQKNKKQNPV